MLDDIRLRPPTSHHAGVRCREHIASSVKRKVLHLLSMTRAHDERLRPETGVSHPAGHAQPPSYRAATHISLGPLDSSTRWASFPAALRGLCSDCCRLVSLGDHRRPTRPASGNVNCPARRHPSLAPGASRGALLGSCRRFAPGHPPCVPPRLDPRILPPSCRRKLQPTCEFELAEVAPAERPSVDDHARRCGCITHVFFETSDHLVVGKHPAASRGSGQERMRNRGARLRPHLWCQEPSVGEVIARCLQTKTGPICRSKFVCKAKNRGSHPYQR
jgi:hypothetical protein